jgi:NADH dehydrogenase [ubiquinone] 1 alpha subcomplex assembly factor 7
MSPLHDILARLIRAHGPMTVSDFMADCLMHPKHGYYQREKVFGVEGDFTTAPEISQLFGEMIGVWLIDQWQTLGSPCSFNLVELGPGRGTLMLDILRAAKSTPKFLSAAKIFFVERSAQLKAEQKKRVPHANWLKDVDALYPGPTIVIANEFFDALPIHQFQKHDGQWLERLIGLDEDDNLVWKLGAPSGALSLMPTTLKYQGQGSVVEICPAALRISGLIAEHIAKNRGAALLIDYGYDKSAVGNTFQALKDHTYVDPLKEVGKADLTAHVNFDMIANAAAQKGVVAHGPTGQGTFLMSIGLGQRAMKLVENLDAAGQEDLLTSIKRLTAPDQMGELFRVLAMVNAEQKSVVGF